MKTSRGYILPDGWEPIEEVPMNQRVNVLYTSGETTCTTYTDNYTPSTTTIGYQFPKPLEKVVEYEVVEHYTQWFVRRIATQHGVAVFNKKHHPSAEQAARAECARLNGGGNE